MNTSLVRAYIDLNAIAHNVKALKALIPEKSKFMAVVKADGYGHGAVRVAETALESGATWLGVARLHEAIQLRGAGINAPILIFGYVHPEDVKTLLDLDLVPTVYNVDMALAFDEKSKRLQKNLRVHLKIDTGMGRVGMLWKEAFNQTRQIAALSKIHIAGIYTHFAAADVRDKTFTRCQLDRFNHIIDQLKTAGIDYGMCHAANSAGIIDHPDSHFDMVRAGISLYGLFPSPEVSRSINLRPAMTLAATITSVRTVPEGFAISYGMTFKTEKPTRIASVPVGYADGYSRQLSSKGIMLVKGEKAPVRGRICMDQTLIDVDHIPGVQTGNEVILIGSQQGRSVTADDLARLAGTINYEVVSALTARVSRIYEPLPDHFYSNE